MGYILVSGWISARLWHHLGWISAVRPADQAAVEGLLAHVANAVRHFANPLDGLPAYVAGGGALLPQAPALGMALLMAPVTLLFGPAAGYALWLTLGFAASGATAYWALSRYLVRSRVAAFVGGAVFAFAPAIIWHANGQPYFVANFLVPVIVVGTLRLRAGRWLRDGVLLGLFSTAQFLLNPEVLALTALGGAVAMLCYSFQRTGTPTEAGEPGEPTEPVGSTGRRSILAGLGVAVGTGLVLLAYPLWYRFAVDPVRHQVPVPDPRLGEDLTTFALFWRDSFAGNFTVARSIGGIEQNSWFGWPLLILMAVIVALFWWRSVTIRVATMVAAVFGFFSLGAQLRLNGSPTGIPGPWWPLSWVPGLDRLPPSHLALVLVPCLAVLVASASDLLPTDDVVSHGLTFRRLWVLLVAVALVPCAPAPLQIISQVNTPIGKVPNFITFGTWRSFVPDGQTLMAVPSSSNGVDATIVRAATLNEIEVPEPYRGGPDQGGQSIQLVGHSPTAELLRSVATTGTVPVVSEQMRETARAELTTWHTSVVILVPGGKLEQRIRELVTDLLNVSPRWLDGCFVWDVRPITKAG